MFEAAEKRSLTMNYAERFQHALILTAGVLILGGAFNQATVAQTPASAPSRKQSAAQTANQAKAEKLIEEAAALRKENTDAAKRRAIDKYKQAAELLQNNNAQRNFIAFDGIAKLYKELNETDRAIRYWRQSLLILRGVNDRRPETTEAEGITLLQIGAVYDERGNREKALENYLQALSLTRESKSYAAAGALNSIIMLHLKTKQPARAAAFIEQEIARARAAGDAETQEILDNILTQVKNGTFKK